MTATGAEGRKAAGNSAGRRGAYAENSTALAPKLTAALKSGDTVLVKGSLGSRMAVIVEALKGAGA